jgi:integrase
MSDKRARPKGQGSIAPRGSGRWQIRWTKGWTQDGKQIRASELFAGSKADAEKRLREKLAEETVIPEGHDFARQSLTGWLDHWLDNVAGLTAAPATVVTYRAYAEHYVKPALGAIRLDALSPVDVQRFVSDLAQRGLAPRTVQLAYRTLARAVRVATSLKVVGRNPCADIVLPKRKKVNPHRALAREEVKKLFEAARGTRFEVLWHLLAGTGLRPQEALALSWDRIDLERCTVRVDRAVTRDAERRPVLGPPKSEAGARTVVIAAELVRLLQGHLAQQRERVLQRGAAYDRKADLVFAGQDGELVDPNTLRRRDWSRLCRAAGIEAQIYDLRHSAATALLASGVNPKLASELLGHADTQLLLNVYGHAPQDADSRADAAAKLAAALYA